MKEYYLDRHSKFLKKLKRDELPYLVLDKSIRYAKELGMHDIMDKMIRYDIVIDRYFKTYTRGGFIDVLQDDNETFGMLNQIQDENMIMTTYKKFP